jgi:alkanesulfonate monooxygenase SsuD/methylene tetrahydromethanopterin reductase-like flavin-dependent oxidoreductase (luciferase family)
MTPLRIGFGVPRGLGDPSTLGEPDHRQMVRYAQRAETLGFDSVWVPDHFFFGRPPGALIPYPEAWTLMTAIGASTERVQIGSMVLAASFRHPALLAKMAGALQQLTQGRVLLGVGAGNQVAEHTDFGFGFDGRVGRFAEYLEILHALLANETVTFRGRHYQLVQASLHMYHPPVPIWVAASGRRMLDLTVRYALGWNGGGATTPDGEPFRSRLAGLRAACQLAGRDVTEIEISYAPNVLVVPDAAAAREAFDMLAARQPGLPAEEVRTRFVIGTPDEVAARLQQIVGWGATHLICSLGAEMFTLWSDSTLELFAREVLPRLRDGQVAVPRQGAWCWP